MILNFFKSFKFYIIHMCSDDIELSNYIDTNVIHLNICLPSGCLSIPFMLHNMMTAKKIGLCQFKVPPNNYASFTSEKYNDM